VARRSMKSIMPRFNATRMVREYIDKMYVPAMAQSRRLLADDAARGRALAAWKARVHDAWPRLTLQRAVETPGIVPSGTSLVLAVDLQLAGLAPEDVVVECIVTQDGTDARTARHSHRLAPRPEASTADGLMRFETELVPELPGLQHYQLRTFPWHEDLAHPFEMGLMKWV